ncbi:MAG: hypothetical protein QOH95_1426 [Gaiellaceae bacterium]|jgi:hypothetical protein|nr:hypothetical protein [Gaiellaceae bacterium]
MTTLTITAPRLTRVAAHPRSPAGEHHRAGRLNGSRTSSFAAHTGLNLHRYPGKVIEHLTFTNVYLGGRAAWHADDVRKIDWALAAAMHDPHLNNVLAQYYSNRRPTSAFKASRILEGVLPHRVYRGAIAGFLSQLEQAGALSGFDLGSTVFNFLLPRGVLLSDHTSAHQQRHVDDDDAPPAFNPALAEHDTADSTHGLGGYHGSVHAKHGGKKTTVYYAVGVYSEGTNGIVAFDKPWKNVCATFYHELCEARTDPDIDDAIRAGDTPEGDAFLGWYSPKGGEIGDMPMDEAGDRLDKVMKEVRLTSGAGRVPIQLMWSNAVGGPEGPIATKHAAQGSS